MARFLLLFFILLAFRQTVSAQLDSTIALQEVTVSASRLRTNAIGGRTERIDSTALAQIPAANLADALQQNSTVYIKSYGLSSLATTAIRGGGASHTAIVWNGFPIRSPMLGLVDLALFPTAFTDAVQINYGSGGALWGSGAVGGTLQLSNQPYFGKHTQVRWSGTGGSFGQLQNTLSVKIGTPNFASTTRLLYQQADNDFSYEDANGLTQRQSNAALQQYALLQEAYWKITPQQQLSARIWWQQMQREIPPTTVQRFSAAEQDDDIFRATLDWQYKADQLTVQARTGLFQEGIDYRDSIAGVDSPSESLANISEVEAEWRFSNQQKFNLGLHHNFTTATTNGYPEGPTQQQFAILGGYQLRSTEGRFLLRANVRQGLVDGEWIPFTPSVGFQQGLSQNVSVKGQVSRSFRLPTFNDLYWEPGGNPDLRAEQGWNQELTAKWLSAPSLGNFQLSLTAFNRTIQNWILWRPGDRFWSPLNIAKVWSRGLEQRFHLNGQSDPFSWLIAQGYDWVRSTQEEAATDAAIGKQLIYTPEHQAFATLTFGFRQLQIRYHHQWVGQVFTRSDNSETMPDYQLGSCQISYDRQFQNWEGRLFFGVQNLWDREYRVIERQRMPGRYWQAGCTLQWTKN